jgi:DNA polymerase III psi subunit
VIAEFSVRQNIRVVREVLRVTSRREGLIIVNAQVDVLHPVVIEAKRVLIVRPEKISMIHKSDKNHLWQVSHIDITLLDKRQLRVIGEIINDNLVVRQHHESPAIQQTMMLQHNMLGQFHVEELDAEFLHNQLVLPLISFGR